MRIISKFHDFYDHVLKNGVDDHVVLHRETKEAPNPGLTFSNITLEQIDDRGERYSRYSFVSGRIFKLEWLFFCGKAYPKLLSFDKLFDSTERHNIKYYDDLDDMEKDIPPKSHYFKSKNWNTGKTNAQLVREILQKDRNIDVEIFRKLNAPYFVYGKNSKNRRYNDPLPIVVYPVLENYTSFLNLDAYSTYQEIEMFCSGAMGVGEPDIIEVSDISKRDSKGFDKFSFKHRK